MTSLTSTVPNPEPGILGALVFERPVIDTLQFSAKVNLSIDINSQRLQPSVVYVLLVCRSFHVSSETQLIHPGATDGLLNERETCLLTYALNVNTMVSIFIVIITKAVIVTSLLQQPTVI